jgi:hypothetical protein
VLIQENFLFGKIGYRIRSDVEIPYINEDKFGPFKSRLRGSSVKIEFKEVKNPLKPFAVDKRNLDLLKKSILFIENWISNPFLCSFQFWHEFERSSKDPNYLKIELAWNRILFFDFLLNRYIYFYSSQSRSMFSGFEYQARVRNLVGLGLPGLQGMLVHGAGVSINNKGALFLAPDEGGKTSTVSLYDNDSILNDDQIVLRFRDNKTHIYSTPFGTISCGNKGSELKGIFLIQKANSFNLVRISPNEVIKFIWDEHFFTICFLPKEIKIKLFNSLANAIRTIPTFQLHLPKGQIDWREIESHLAG